MATKTTTVSGETQSSLKQQGSNPVSNFVDKSHDLWQEFSRFLSDVRAELRKVVTPSRNEVRSTTTVVLFTVGVFGVFFFVVDYIFQHGLHLLLGHLGGF